MNTDIEISFLLHTAMADFTSGMYPFTIREDEVQTAISIPITDDQTVEQKEQFSVSLSLQPQPGLSLDISDASITIVDDDGMICFSCIIRILSVTASI